MRLEGTLDGFSLADIFQLLSFTKKTGALYLRRTTIAGEVTAVVYVGGGAVTGANSDLRRHALGRRLVGGGHIDDDVLEAAVRRAASEPSLGLLRALRAQDALDERVLHAQATEQLHDAVFELLRWCDGDFSFVIDAPNPDELGVAVPIEDVLIEGRRRLALLADTAQLIPAPDTVLSINLAPPEDPRLDRDEWSLLALVDGRRTVAEVAALTGRGDFAVLLPLCALVERGLLQAAVDNSGAAALVRRQSLLARLEQPEVSTPQPVAARAPVPTRPAPRAVSTPPVPEQRAVIAVQAEVPAAAQPERPQPVARISRPTPKRSAVARLAPVADEPAAASYAEAEPPLDKELLMRLIAGVRGL